MSTLLDVRIAERCSDCGKPIAAIAAHSARCCACLYGKQAPYGQEHTASAADLVDWLDQHHVGYRLTLGMTLLEDDEVVGRFEPAGRPPLSKPRKRAAAITTGEFVANDEHGTRDSDPRARGGDQDAGAA